MTRVQVSTPTTIRSNCQYNIIEQLEKKMQFLLCVDGYINDADKEGNRKCAETFRQIKASEERHVRMLKEVLSEFHQSR